MKKDIEVLIKVPHEWIDGDELNMLSFFRGTVKDRLEGNLIDEIVEKVMEKMELPKVEITTEEVKDRVLTLMAQEVMDKR